MNRYLAGSLAGFVATIPMTAVMLGLHRLLPRHERYALPPRELTVRMAQKAGVLEKLDENQRTGATWAGHFFYGSAVGAVYSATLGRVFAPVAPVLSVGLGAAYGAGVWSASYLGWIPAAGLLSSASRHPVRRNALMLAAHLMYGGAMGFLTDLLQNRAQLAHKS